jgi:hypothetical protein
MAEFVNIDIYLTNDLIGIATQFSPEQSDLDFSDLMLIHPNLFDWKN